MERLHALFASEGSPSADLDWSLILSLLAIVISSVGLFVVVRRERRDSNLANEARLTDERALAAGVAAWVRVEHHFGDQPEEDSIELEIVIQNSSTLPVRHVSVRAVNDGDRTVHVAYHPVVAPGVALTTHQTLIGDEVWCEHYRTSATFTDSRGVRWQRDTAGGLRRLPSEFSIYSGVDLKDGLSRYKNLFKQEFALDVRVDTTYAGAELRSFFTSTLYDGRACDAIVAPHDWMGQFLDASLIRPIPVPNSTSRDPLVKEALEAFSVGLASNGVPLAYDTAVLFINRSLYKGATPGSVQGILAAGRESVRAAGGRGPGLSMSTGERPNEGDPFMMWPLLAGLGGFMFKPDSDSSWRPSASALREGNLRLALTKLQDLARKYPEEFQAETAHREAREIFAAGSVPFHIDVSGARVEMDCEFEVELVPMPVPSDQVTRPGLSLIYGFYFRRMLVESWDPTSGAAKGDYARNGEDFLHYHLSSRAVCASLSTELGMPVISRSGLVDEGVFAAVVRDACQNARPMPNLRSMGDVWSVLGKLVSGTVRQKSVSHTVRQASGEMDEVLAAEHA